MKTLLSFAAAAVLSLVVAANASACVTFQQAFNPTFKNDANYDLNDYGRIHHDGDDANCAEAAMYSLTDKLNQHLNAKPTPTYQPFKNWLDGFLVAEIFAATMRIGVHGWASEGLDTQLARVVDQFDHNIAEPSGTCGGDEWNTCMDDLTGTASAYAWMGAYMQRRPNRWTTAQADAKLNLAEQYLHQALKPITAAEPKNGICLRDTPVISSTNSYLPLCTGTITELRNGTAQTFTLNGQRQMLHYGFGLMTSVASAVRGLEAAGRTVAFSEDEKLIAKALLQEVNLYFNASTRNYDPKCTKKDLNDKNEWLGTWSKNVDCGVGYDPDMYALRAFYDTRLGGVPAGSYDSNSFDSWNFKLHDQWSYMPDGTKVDKEFFSYGRFETYGIQAYAWWVSNPPKTWMPYDAYAPRGWVDGISTTGVASGWACDPDMTTGRTFVDFYDGTTRVARATANQYSGSMYAAQCGSGTAHRYSVQLPSSSQNRSMRVWVHDYTWIGPTEIGCTSGCAW